MRKYSQSVLLIIIFLSVSIRRICCQEQVFTPLKKATESFINTNPAATKYIVVRANPLLLANPKTSVFTIYSPDENPIVIVRKKIEKKTAKKFVWYGVIKNDPYSLVLFSVNDSLIHGTVEPSVGNPYSVNYIGKKKHLISEISREKIIETPHPMPAPPMLQPADGLDNFCVDPANRVDVLVVYTQGALAFKNNSVPDIENLITAEIARTNLTYINCNIDLQLNNVGMAFTAYSESGSGVTDRDNLENGTDAATVAIRNLRNSNKADFVIMLVATLDAGGDATITAQLDPAFEKSAFAVMRISNLVNQPQEYVFPHEVGHILSARHNRPTDATENSPFVFNHGSFFYLPPSEGVERSYRSIMSYNLCTSGACIKKPLWSSPSVFYTETGDVVATGTDSEDNARSITATRSLVANFRCRTPLVQNVWMRDTENDTGLEPDPNTAGESMYRSPYIWVRNSQDDATASPPYPNQHLHQNPIYGQRNFIYIKLHNGGPDINGHLKIHIAEANPGNTWPASWSLIKDTLLTIQSLSTRIVEIPWDVIEGNGHFCLTAWWISAEDPMNFVVTDNIGYNTRQSNNIIWRNVNIIDMGDAALQAKAVFMLKRSNADTINLSFSEPVNFPKTRFLETGKIIIEPDSKIFNAWKLGGSKSSGVRLISNNRFLITSYPARLNNINLPLHAKGKINVRFEKSTKTIKDKFTFVVTQFKSANTKLHHAGGIAYEIYTYKIPSY